MISISRKKPLTDNEFSLSSEVSVDDFLEELSQGCSIETDRPVYVDRTYYDSFDWRIFEAGGRLCHERHRDDRKLIWCSTQQGIPKITLPRIAKVPNFSDQFAVGAMRSVIAPSLEMRALMPKVDLVTRVQLVRVLDDERKTVVRVKVEENRVRPKKEQDKEGKDGFVSTRIEIMPVRGYEDDLNRLRERFSKLDCLTTGMPKLLEEAMAVVGDPIGSYSTKLKFHFNPQLQVNQAVQQIHSFLLGIMEVNMTGVRDDTDSEFLHDFRVAVRRTRSALTQIKGVFTDKQVAYFSERFSWLGQITGPTRDMHVYLLDFSKYRDSLPERFRSDLKPLKSFLREHQRKELNKLVKRMSSPEFEELFNEWRNFLLHDALSEEGESATQKVGEVASKRIAKMYQRVMDEGRAINASSVPEDLHELRKSCKKLRYLMEFFVSIYPPDLINGLIKEIKQLLDNLGDFQDLEVQAEKLRDFAHQMAAEGNIPADTFLAMGMLVDGLLRRQLESREQFYDRFKAFSSSENRKIFHALFVTNNGVKK